VMPKQRDAFKSRLSNDQYTLEKHRINWNRRTIHSVSLGTVAFDCFPILMSVPKHNKIDDVEGAERRKFVLTFGRARVPLSNLRRGIS
jgi:hypothetical protein